LAANSGLQFNLNRWYAPWATVWISADPSGFSAGDMNLYRYLGNNPVALSDGKTDVFGHVEGGQQRPFLMNTTYQSGRGARCP
jgi:hypothetical protein